MSESLQNIRHANVHLIHGELEAHGFLEYSPKRKCLEIVLPPSNVLTPGESERIPVTKWMLDHLEILPDGKIQIRC